MKDIEVTRQGVLSDQSCSEIFDDIVDWTTFHDDDGSIHDVPISRTCAVCGAEFPSRSDVVVVMIRIPDKVCGLWFIGERGQVTSACVCSLCILREQKRGRNF